MKAQICRVRELMTLEGRYSPPGTAARTASHSWLVRLAGSAGHVVMTAEVRSVRHFAERRERPACSCAMRTIRSLTRMPMGGAAVQPRRRSAIHAFDGSFLPPASCPEASAATSVAFQCAASSSVVMPATRSTAQPTRSASARVASSSPVRSSTPARSRPRAQAVRAVSPAASGTFRLNAHPSRQRCCHLINDTVHERSPTRFTSPCAAFTPGRPEDRNALRALLMPRGCLRLRSPGNVR